jgi:hypothetical protein
MQEECHRAQLEDGVPHCVLLQIKLVEGFPSVVVVQGNPADWLFSLWKVVRV